VSEASEERSSPQLVVSIFDRSYQRLGQVPDFVSCAVTWQWLGIGTGTLVVEETDPVGPYLLGVDGGVVPVVVDVGGVRWSGRVSSASLEREGPPGSGTISVTLVDDWVWLHSMIASQNGSNPALTAMPEFDTRTGNLATVAVAYINAAATRLGAPVVAIGPTPDTSPSVTLKARMNTLADLLTDSLRAAGVRLTASIWLPGDPQPSGVAQALTEPTVVVRADLPPAKPWLRWSDTVGGLVSASVTRTTQKAFRALLGLSGTEAARVYDEVIDTTAQTVAGDYGLPEIYVDSSNVDKGTASQQEGANALLDTVDRVALEAEVADGEPWAFGRDYEVGDTGTVVVAGVDFSERVTKVTVSEDRDTGLTYTPVVGENPGTGSSNDLMIRAMGTIARQLRTVQSGR
jgi:hypothetical protein